MTCNGHCDSYYCAYQTFSNLKIRLIASVPFAMEADIISALPFGFQESTNCCQAACNWSRVQSRPVLPLGSPGLDFSLDICGRPRLVAIAAEQCAAGPATSANCDQVMGSQTQCQSWLILCCPPVRLEQAAQFLFAADVCQRNRVGRLRLVAFLVLRFTNSWLFFP